MICLGDILGEVETLEIEDFDLWWVFYLGWLPRLRPNTPPPPPGGGGGGGRGGAAARPAARWECVAADAARQPFPHLLTCLGPVPLCCRCLQMPAESAASIPAHDATPPPPCLPHSHHFALCVAWTDLHVITHKCPWDAIQRRYGALCASSPHPHLARGPCR